LLNFNQQKKYNIHTVTFIISKTFLIPSTINTNDDEWTPKASTLDFQKYSEKLQNLSTGLSEIGLTEIKFIALLAVAK
jgi:hypothetical protein